MYYAYDELNRLVDLRRDADEVAYFVYDALGRRSRVDHGSGAVSYYAYDAASRLTSIDHRKSDDTVLASFDYAHDAVGNPLRMTLANGDRYFAHFPNSHEVTLVPGDQYPQYAETVDQRDYFGERLAGLWGVVIVSLLAAIFLLATSYLPTRG